LLLQLELQHCLSFLQNLPLGSKFPSQDAVLNGLAFVFSAPNGDAKLKLPKNPPRKFPDDAGVLAVMLALLLEMRLAKSVLKLLFCGVPKPFCGVPKVPWNPPKLPKTAATGADVGAGAGTGAGFGAGTDAGTGTGARVGADTGDRVGADTGGRVGADTGARVGAGTGAREGAGTGARVGAGCCCCCGTGSALAPRRSVLYEAIIISN